MNQPSPHPGRGRAARRSAAVRYDDRGPPEPVPASSREALPPPWPRDDVLDPALLLEVRSINLRGVAMLQEAAGSLVALDAEARAAASAAGGVSALIEPALRDWLVLDADARERLASQPFLLFDIALEDPSRWRQLLAGAVGEEVGGPGVGSAPRGPMLAYARVLLHYAWHLARTVPRTAAVVAGMAADTAALLRGCSVQRVDEIAPRCAHWLQPRWAADPAIWSELLCAARSGSDPGRTRRASLRALQRIGGALARIEAARGRAGAAPLW